MSELASESASQGELGLGGRPARGEDDDRGVDHVLVDGVAPSVIGGDAAVEYESPTYRDPPTTPIPAGAEPERRQSWLAKVFRRD